MNVIERAGLATWSTADLGAAVENWLSRLAAALAARDAAALASLLGPMSLPEIDRPIIIGSAQRPCAVGER